MRDLLLPLGILAWVAVAGLSWWMASIDEPVLGFFPILAGVFGAWAIGEYVTDVVWREKHGA